MMTLTSTARLDPARRDAKCEKQPCRHGKALEACSFARGRATRTLAIRALQAESCSDANPRIRIGDLNGRAGISVVVVCFTPRR